jgi:PST family polysaccharide transporter
MTAALVVVDFSGIFIYMGIGPAIIQHPQLREQHLSTGLIASLLFSVVVQLIVWFGAPLIAQFFGERELIPIVRMVSFVFPLRGISIVAFSLLQRDMRFRDIARADVAAYLLAFGPIAIGLALMGAGTYSLVIAYLVNGAVTSALYLLMKPPKITLKVNRNALSDLLRFGSGLTLARIAGYFGSNADNLVVGRLLGMRALGLYGRAYGVMSSAVKISGNMVDKVLFPAIARVQDDPRRLQNGLKQAQTAIALSILPASALLIVLAPEVISLVLGSQWIDAVPVFQILAAGMLFRAGHRTCVSVAGGTGAAYRIALIQFIYATSVVAGALVGQRWGIKGVATGVLVAMFAGYIAAGKTALDLTGMKWSEFCSAHKPGLIVAFAVLLVSWTIAEGLRWLNVPDIAVLVPAMAASATVAFFLARSTVKLLLGPQGMEQLMRFIRVKTKPGKDIAKKEALRSA